MKKKEATIARDEVGRLLWQRSFEFILHNLHIYSLTMTFQFNSFCQYFVYSTPSIPTCIPPSVCVCQYFVYSTPSIPTCIPLIRVRLSIFHLFHSFHPHLYPLTRVRLSIFHLFHSFHPNLYPLIHVRLSIFRLFHSFHPHLYPLTRVRLSIFHLFHSFHPHLYPPIHVRLFTLVSIWLPLAWLGASDQAQEGVWRWLTNNDLINIPSLWWNPGEPDGGVGIDGLVMDNGLLYDRSLTAQYFSTCQKCEPKK